MKIILSAALFVVLLLISFAPGEAAGLNARISPFDPSAVPQTEAMAAVSCVNGFAGSYPCNNVDLLAFVPLASLNCGSAAVVWGWTDPDSAREYALLACNNGVSFVDITVPTSPVFVGRLPGQTVNSSWRDVKVIGNWAFVGSEASGHGIQIFDLTRLRGLSGPPVTFANDAHYAQVGRSHTLATNEQSGYLYAAGSQTTCGGDLHMIDVTAPLAPAFAGCLGFNGYVHEAQCVTYAGPDAEHQGKEICFNYNGRFDASDTLGIDDVTNKAAPVQLSRVGYPGSGYTHQGWLTEDQQYLLLNDEFDEQDFGHPTKTYIWNVVDLDNPVLLGHFSGRTAAIDHNLYTRGTYMFQSNYRAGLSVIDLRDIASGSLTEYGYFDIYPANDLPEFNGAWGNYPYFPSGNVVVSGIEQGLFVLRPNLLPTVSVNDVSAVEGTASNRTATFTLSLSAPMPNNVLVHFATAAGTATAGADFTAATGSIVIPAGALTRTRSIVVVGDDQIEENETFTLQLTGAFNADLGDSEGVATILDDDLPTPTLHINDISVSEGDEGTTSTSLTVTLQPVSGETITVDWATDDFTAVAPDDYASDSGTLTFQPGETSHSIPLTIYGDMDIEDIEAFRVLLSNASASVADASGSVAILNDDVLSVDALSPTSGPAAGGTPVTITGTRFAPEAEVTFGGTHAAAFTWISQSEIEAVTPPLPPAQLIEVHVDNQPHVHGSTPPNHRAGVTFFSNFLDVSSDHSMSSFIETIFRLGVTTGCDEANYCPGSPVSRAQMAIFLLRSKYSRLYVPPAASGMFEDVPAEWAFAPWIERLAVEEITSGCSTEPSLYCPNNPVTRAQMAVFLLKAREGSSYTPPPATGIFSDVPAESAFAPWIEELSRRGITAGCGASKYCPSDPVIRAQMAAFLVRTFALAP